MNTDNCFSSAETEQGHTIKRGRGKLDNRGAQSDRQCGCCFRLCPVNIFVVLTASSRLVVNKRPVWPGPGLAWPPRGFRGGVFRLLVAKVVIRGVSGLLTHSASLLVCERRSPPINFLLRPRVLSLMHTDARKTCHLDVFQHLLLTRANVQELENIKAFDLFITCDSSQQASR